MSFRAKVKRNVNPGIMGSNLIYCGDVLGSI
jgi:hypothetical protein